jgi:hypothetical protein
MKKQAALLTSMILLSSSILAGCSSGAPGTLQQSTNQTNSPTTSAANSSDTVSTTTNTSSSENTSTSATNPSTSTGNQATTAPPVSANNTAVVKQYLSFAKEGKIASIPFAEESNMGAVYQVWGQKPETSAGAGLYTTYSAEHAAFGFNKGEQIFDLRSYSPQLKTITQSDITRALGKPGAVRYTSDSYIYLYPAGPDYQLLWIFQKDSSGKPMSHVDHVSVFWPEGTINLMAETDPAPVIVLNNRPGEVGSLFTFSIRNTPKDYHLAELEWISNHGTSIVNTASQAMENAGAGNHISGFAISRDGKTFSFDYPASLIGQTGHARVIYQATSGVAMIGDGPEITLK